MTSLTSLLSPSCYYEHNSHRPTISFSPPSHGRQQQQSHRQFATKRNPKGKKNNKSSQKFDENAPLLNEHLVAELFNEINKKERGGGGGGAAKISPDTFEVRLIIDAGRKKGNDSDDEDDDNSSNNSSSSSSNESRIVTLNEAINISHELSLDLMEVTLKQDPPVIKAVSYDKWLYDQKKKLSNKSSDKKGGGSDAAAAGGGGGGAISDRPLKEFKFRAGIANHDLERKTNNMLNYLAKGHAIRVTLTARQRSLNDDAQAISTTLDRVKELIGDKAVEVRGMKANDRLSYGNLLFHPNKNS
jgi:translation initiation factor IF-3